MDEKISASDRLALWISLIIPGVITALVDFDISIFATYAVVASLLGPQTLALLVLVYTILHVLNSISGRVVIVSDKGLIELIRERYGIIVSLLVFITIGVLDFLVVIQNFLAVHLIADLFRMNFLAFSFIVGAYMFIILVFRIQKFRNRIFVFIGLFYFSAVIHIADQLPSAAAAIVSNKFTFLDLFSGHTSLYFLALLGSTVSAWNQFLITRYTYRTKLNLDKLEYHTLDNRTSTIATFGFAVLFVTLMALLFPNGDILKNQLSIIKFIPLSQPLYQMYLFGFGFLFIALTNIYAVSLSFSHAFTEFFGMEHSDEERGKFNTAQNMLYLLLVIPAIFIVQSTGMQLLPTAVTMGFIQFLFIFIMIFFLLKFANNRAIMGRYTNDWLHNALLTVIAVFLLVVFIGVFVQMIFHV